MSKDTLKKVIPATYGKVESANNKLTKEINGLKKEIISSAKAQNKEAQIKFEELNKKINQYKDEMQTQINQIEDELKNLERKLHLIDLQEKKILRASNENVWAHVFHDAVIDSEWLKNRCFYPGRWAAGYPFLYALYRCLNDFQPESILEMGLGQTTRVIGQYAAYNKNCKHLVTEHDQEWIDTFQKGFKLSNSTEIIKLDITKKSYYDTEPCTVYVGFKEVMSRKKFDLISIDAPFGGDKLEYSRMDILSIMPDCLNDDFVILLDDYNRQGEKKMIEKLKKILEENNIEYVTGLYWGNKDTYMIASSSLKFLCTM